MNEETFEYQDGFKAGKKSARRWFFVDLILLTGSLAYGSYKLGEKHGVAVTVASDYVKNVFMLGARAGYAQRQADTKGTF